jgi:hypothetical protein
MLQDGVLEQLILSLKQKFWRGTGINVSWQKFLCF